MIVDRVGELADADARAILVTIKRVIEANKHLCRDNLFYSKFVLQVVSDSTSLPKTVPKNARRILQDVLDKSKKQYLSLNAHYLVVAENVPITGTLLSKLTHCYPPLFSWFIKKATLTIMFDSVAILTIVGQNNIDESYVVSMAILVQLNEKIVGVDNFHFSDLANLQLAELFSTPSYTSLTFKIEDNMITDVHF